MPAMVVIFVTTPQAKANEFSINGILLIFLPHIFLKYFPLLTKNNESKDDGLATT
jgi:hypothetical protein